MSSGSQGVQSQYHIQRVGDQYELLATGRLRSSWVTWIRGEYAASKESLGRLVHMANRLSTSRPEGYEMRLRSLVRSLAGMLEVCSPDQKDEVQSTLLAVRKLLPSSKESESVSTLASSLAGMLPSSSEDRRTALDQIVESVKSFLPQWEGKHIRGKEPSLTGILTRSSQDQKEKIRHTMMAVRDLFPPAQDGNPETLEEKLAIAKSIIERACSGKTPAHCPLALLESKDKQTLSPLAQCFQEYFSRTKETDKELCRIIQAVYENGEDYGEALLRALGTLGLGRRPTKDNPRTDQERTIGRAILLFAKQALDPCMKALRKPQSKDFGRLLLRARQGIELVLSAGIDAECLNYAVPDLMGFFSRMVTEELNFSMTVARTSRRFLRPAPTEEEEAREWAATSPSMPLAETIGRIPAIEIGGNPENGLKTESQLMHAYRYSQALKKYLESQKIAHASDVANQLLLRCTVECSSDILFKCFGWLLSLQPKSQLPPFKEDASELNEHPVIEPERPTVRFSVEKGKCVIERVCPMRFGFQYVWRVSRAVLDPNAIGDQWTETVTTKPYAQALADEVQRRITQEGKPRGVAIEEVQAAVGKQFEEGAEVYQSYLAYCLSAQT